MGDPAKARPVRPLKTSSECPFCRPWRYPAALTSTLIPEELTREPWLPASRTARASPTALATRNWASDDRRWLVRISLNAHCQKCRVVSPWRPRGSAPVSNAGVSRDCSGLPSPTPRRSVAPMGSERNDALLRSPAACDSDTPRGMGLSGCRCQLSEYRAPEPRSGTHKRYSQLCEPSRRHARRAMKTVAVAGIFSQWT